MPRRGRRPRQPARESLRRGIYLIPSLFTVGNMLCGFAAMLHAIHGRLALAAWLVILAAVLDGLDGRIARLTHSTSEFGKEYDSLADVISFGVAPAILVFQWGLWNLGRGGWASAFLFLVAGSVRLARFNVKSANGDRNYFTGLPIPAGAGALSMLVLVHPQPPADRLAALAACAVVLLVALLMVSTIAYRSYKDFNLRQRWPATTFFVVAVAIAVVAVSPIPTMAVLCAAYLLSGPVELAMRRSRQQPAAADTSAAESVHAEPPPASVDRP